MSTRGSFSSLTVPLALALAAGFFSCSDPPKIETPQAPPANKPPPPAGPCGDFACENAVDKVVVPMLLQGGRSPVADTSEALCLRLALDLNGITPSPAEVKARCAGRTPAEMVRYFMEKPSAVHVPSGQPPYVYVGRRWWSEIFNYYVVDSDLNTPFYAYVLMLDKLVESLYRGQIGYDKFAVEAMAAPAFMRRFGLFNVAADPAQVAAAAIRIFLGREALPSEAADFGGLFRPYRLVATSFADAKARFPDCNTCVHYAVSLSGGACSGGEAALCQSSVFGPARLHFELASGKTTRIEELTGNDAEMLRLPGRLLTSRRDFAEAIVDRTLDRYLGWWNAGIYRPDYNLPAVRDALVDFFIAHGYNIRDLDVEILTSVLYTQSQRLRDGDIAEAPLYAHGPLKPLMAENFLDSLGAALGMDIGGCDFRFSAATTATGGFDVRNKIAAAYTFPLTPGIESGFYTVTARKLGGCPSGGERGDPSGLVPALARREALTRLCANALAQTNLVPADMPMGIAIPDGLGRLLDNAFLRSLGHPADPAERTRFSDNASPACTGGKCDYKQLSTQLCMALFSSALLNFY